MNLSPGRLTRPLLYAKTPIDGCLSLSSRRVVNITNIYSTLNLRMPLLIIALTVLTGCASAPRETSNEQVTPAQVQATQEAGDVDVSQTVETAEAPREPMEYPVAPFTGDTLFDLLAAEVAGYRTEYDFALEKYVAVAEETRDPQVAARAKIGRAHV